MSRGRHDRIRVAFIQPYCVEPLGVMHISAVLTRHGHRTRLFIEGLEGDLEGAVIAWEPDVVGFQTFTGQHKWALGVARRLKSLAGDIRVVFGGPHATFVPEIVQEDGVDLVVRGEGEFILRDLCDALAARDDWTRLPGTWAKGPRGNVHENPLAPLIPDLDALPFPDRGLPYRYDALGKRGNKAFIGGRGCHNPCTFCHNHVAMRLFKGLGPWARRQSPERLIEEIETVHDGHPPLRVLNFENDDDILGNPSWFEEFFARYSERIHLPFYIMTRPDHVKEDRIRLIRDAGCVGVALSLETANDETRNRVLKKRFTTDQFLDAMSLLHRYDLPVKVFNMLGIPGETLDDALNTLQLNIDAGATWAMCSLLQPYPRTDIFRHCRDKGLFKREVGPDVYDSLYVLESLLDLPDIDAMVNLQKFFSIVVRFPALLGTVKRLIHLKPNPLFHRLGLTSYAITGARSHHLSIPETVRMVRSSRVG